MSPLRLLVETMSPELDLLKGTLDVLVLKALTWGPRHGYSVARWIMDTCRDAIFVEDAALYTALHRMEKRDWVRSEWGLSENNRKARYYQLTAAGRKQLRTQHSGWMRYAAAVTTILDANA
ncbi:MAG: PadR family transcriptional regulator [Gemmatimonadaceae bacterium]